jgi:hypothetical protein
MKKFLNYITFAVIVISLVECQTKKLQLELEETACKNFKISSPTYQWVNNVTPCTGNTQVILKVTFNYSGDKNCIDKINFNPIFYRSDNSAMNTVGYTSAFQKSNPSVVITSSSITVTDTLNFASSTDAKALNFIYLALTTENDVQARSNELEMRVTTPCTGPGTYKVNTTVQVTQNTFDLFLYDDAAEDGDIVSVYLNGSWIIENYTLTNAGKTFYSIPINSGNNDLVIVACNTGKSGPNTCGVKINGGSHISLNPDLLTGQAVRIQF